MKTIEIPGGQAVIRDHEDLTVRQQRSIEAAAGDALRLAAKLPGDPETWGQLTEVQLAEAGIDGNDLALMNTVQDRSILAGLESWTLPDPIPMSVEELQDLKAPVYRALQEATAELGATVATGVSFDPSDPTAEGFDRTPTHGSAASVNA